MNNSSDFVIQVNEVEQNLKTEWQSTQEGWQDRVAEGFNEGVMVPLLKNYQQYLSGEGISGYGLEQLIQQMERHLQDMASLTN